jgi:hypothetical protein
MKIRLWWLLRGKMDDLDTIGALLVEINNSWVAYREFLNRPGSRLQLRRPQENIEGYNTYLERVKEVFMKIDKDYVDALNRDGITPITASIDANIELEMKYPKFVGIIEAMIVCKGYQNQIEQLHDDYGTQIKELKEMIKKLQDETYTPTDEKRGPEVG